MFPDVPAATCHINHMIATRPGFTRRVNTLPDPEWTVETAVIPGEELIGHTLFARYKTPNEESGLGERSRPVTIVSPSPAYAGGC